MEPKLNNINVNIFGVMRSGTKLIQLYSCLSILERFKTCYVSYEPFYWFDRSCSYASKLGIDENQRLPILMEKEKICRFKSKFINKLGPPKKNPIVTKYVRANGRINFINDITGIKKTIIIIRPLKGVLNSIYSCDWDLLGKNLWGIDEWIKLKKEVLDFGNKFPYKKWLKNIDQKKEIDRNAFYWAVLNHFALSNIFNYENILLLNFDEILNDYKKNLKQIDKFIGLAPPKLNFEYISGGSMHTDDYIYNINNQIQYFFRDIQEKILQIYFNPKYQIHINEIVFSNKTILEKVINLSLNIGNFIGTFENFQKFVANKVIKQISKKLIPFDEVKSRNLKSEKSKRIKHKIQQLSDNLIFYKKNEFLDELNYIILEKYDEVKSKI